MKSLRIALLAGGVSAEREVSLKTGAMIRAALSGRHKIYPGRANQKISNCYPGLAWFFR